MKFISTKLGIKKIQFNDAMGYIEFNEKTSFAPETIIKLLSSDPKTYQMQGPLKLKIEKKLETPVSRIHFVNTFLTTLH